jgi:hypothetical protein
VREHPFDIESDQIEIKLKRQNNTLLLLLLYTLILALRWSGFLVWI